MNQLSEFRENRYRSKTNKECLVPKVCGTFKAGPNVKQLLSGYWATLSNYVLIQILFQL